MTRYGTRLRCCRRARSVVPMPRHPLTLHITPQQECSNPNVVRYFGSFVGREFLWIVMEYCGGGAQPDTRRSVLCRLTCRVACRLDARRAQRSQRTVIRGANSVRVSTMPAGACQACAGSLHRSLT